jgi:hypothetical protein
MPTPGFQFIQTEDGSPSLKIQSEQGPEESLTEPMHSLKGAFAETLYIYGTAIDTAWQKRFPLHICSLGLGLGYNEILSAAVAGKYALMLTPHQPQQTLMQVSGESFELIPELSFYFSAWVRNSAHVPNDFQNAYDLILRKMAEQFALTDKFLKSILQNWFESGQWQLREALTAQSDFFQPYSVLFFDAFSSKTSPELWEESFLDSFLTKSCAPACVFSTYACTGALKRALKRAGFEVEIREGFSSKRESTFALRTGLGPGAHR